MKRVLILGRQSLSTQMLFATVKKAGYKVSFIEERRDDKWLLIKRRAHRIGFFNVFSQLVFLFFQSFLSSFSKERKLEILELQSTKVVEVKARSVFTNINSVDAIDAVVRENADLIILSGTRILNNQFLSQVNVPIINIHAGITPLYRGVHGGYWALVNKDSKHFGATIHRVDEGVDTGEVLVHAHADVTSQDNFCTYPLLQQAAALELLPDLLKKIFSGADIGFKPDLSSKVWTHPTIWQYLRYRLLNGVK